MTGRSSPLKRFSKRKMNGQGRRTGVCSIFKTKKYTKCCAKRFVKTHKKLQKAVDIFVPWIKWIQKQGSRVTKKEHGVYRKISLKFCG